MSYRPELVLQIVYSRPNRLWAILKVCHLKIDIFETLSPQFTFNYLSFLTPSLFVILANSELKTSETLMQFSHLIFSEMRAYFLLIDLKLYQMVNVNQMVILRLMNQCKSDYQVQGVTSLFA